jgi:ADP-heptose:LPS heptosyltransferase
MNWRRPLLDLAARLVRGTADPASATPRLLVIRRNRLGDMICTLPLLHALRNRFPGAHLAVACDPPGVPIATASGVVNEVVVLRAASPFALLENAQRLQGFDAILVAKGGFDRRQATLARLTNGARRVGFDATPSLYYTDPVPAPPAHGEHQIETQLRLLAPLEIAPPVVTSIPPLQLPTAALEFADALLASSPWNAFLRFILINISSTTRLRFREEDFIALTRRILSVDAGVAILFVAAPADQSRAREMAQRCPSERAAAVATPGPLELAALMRHAALFITPEGGAAHLAATAGLPTLVLWSEGPMEKWRSRAENHVFVQAAPFPDAVISVDDVWPALEPMLPQPTRT